MEINNVFVMFGKEENMVKQVERGNNLHVYTTKKLLGLEVKLYYSLSQHLKDLLPLSCIKGTQLFMCSGINTKLDYWLSITKTEALLKLLQILTIAAFL